MALNGFPKFLPNACPLKLQHPSIGSAASNKTDETFPPSRERGGMCFPRMMLLQVINMTWVVGVILILEMAASAAILAAAAAPLAKPNCNDRCGNVEIPFPFGTSERCYLDHNYFVNCTYDSSGKTRRPMYGNFVVQNISLEGQFEFFGYPVYECFNELGTPDNRSSRLLVNFSSSFSYTHNLFVAIGCDTIAYLNGTKNNANFSTGCLSVCENINDVANGSCSGIGCCQLNIPKGLGESSLSVRSFSGHKGVWKSNPCSYAFIVKRDAFHFSPEYLIPNVSNMKFPVVFDWGIRYETCERAIAKSDILCGRNSACYDSSYGYRCRCNPGYGGNPYLLNGCQDINECQSGNNCTYPERCKNTMGNYTCSCRKGSRGDGRKDGTGCVAKKGRKDRKIGAGIGTTSLVLVVGSVGVYWVIQTRCAIKLRLEIFNAQLSNHQGSMKPVIFRARELEKATNNYDKSRKLRQGGDGTVYRGVLTDNKVVAIKKSETVDEDQIKHFKDQIKPFINEMIVLTQINHKNVVKLLGCCLETKVPSLVYEFITDWTLSDHIHDKDKSSLLSWEKRLKIATEAARALAYLHSKSIIHRNVKSANILLDENHTVRVAEFGASRLVPLDHMRLEQGTFEYLDPEYLRTGQLIEKSDVYSFGVILAELLTGKKNLPTYSVSPLNEDCLEIIERHIKNEDNVEELKEVLDIAKRCLSINGEDRLTMKAVEKKLNDLRIKKNHSNEEESECSIKGDLGLDAGIANSSPSTTIDNITQFLPTCCSMIPLF
ncbi:wall-associated receptor kinase 2-like [Carya illinoinensis]|uniref:wall-associated receptor kinase 2-like n=1 Tax=Carya illinoinensis TaxID=32201 RepID=UPI001C7227C6|nr:wall-associated receptor kinase 2-like [Carya illinoinensis]